MTASAPSSAQPLNVFQAINAQDASAMLAAVRRLDTWTEEVAQFVHNALIAWATTAMAEPRPEAWVAMYDLLGRLRSAHGEQALDRALPEASALWRGFELLLNERIARHQHQAL